MWLVVPLPGWPSVTSSGWALANWIISPKVLKRPLGLPSMTSGVEPIAPTVAKSAGLKGRLGIICGATTKLPLAVHTRV
ncbi:hypothetical protein D3C71_1669600 [compost metagenome]